MVCLVTTVWTLNFMAEKSSRSTAPDRIRWDALLCISTLIVFALYALKTFSRFQSPGDLYLDAYADDFFYYLKIAKSFNEGLGLTFDGTTTTNGFHPLWMGLVVLFFSVTGSGYGAVVCVSICIATMCAATYALAFDIVRVLTGSWPLSLLAAICTTIMYFKVAGQGMEVVLTVPMLLLAGRLFLTRSRRELTDRELIFYGFLASIIVLSRLDSAVYVITFWIGVLVAGGYRNPVRFLRALSLFALGSMPFFVYFAINYEWMGTLLPISGMAKQLKPLFTLPTWPKIAGGSLFLYIQLSLALAAFVTLVARPRSSGIGTGWQRDTVVVMLLTPFLFFFVHSMLTDWKLWPWYLYPCVVLTPFALGILFAPIASLGEKWKLMRMGFAVVAVLALAGYSVRTIQKFEVPLVREDLVAFAFDLAEFAKSHPGRYAMGDRAGIVGYVLDQPVMQLEGLVQNLEFLRDIKRGNDLVAVLQKHGVDYYVARDPEPENGCYRVSEPFQAGPESPRMNALICDEPVHVFEAKGDEALVQAVFIIK